MAEDKPRPVRIISPGYVQGHTNDLRINRDAAERLIARYLRAKMLPADANDLASQICDGIVMNMPAASRPALRGFRMIPEYPPDDVVSKVATDLRSIDLDERHDWSLGRTGWEIVYRHGQALPDDVVI